MRSLRAVADDLGSGVLARLRAGPGPGIALRENLGAGGGGIITVFDSEIEGLFSVVPCRLGRGSSGVDMIFRGGCTVARGELGDEELEEGTHAGEAGAYDADVGFDGGPDGCVGEVP